jgi:hypothetical protein
MGKAPKFEIVFPQPAAVGHALGKDDGVHRHTPVKSPV